MPACASQFKCTRSHRRYYYCQGSSYCAEQRCVAGKRLPTTKNPTPWATGIYGPNVRMITLTRVSELEAKSYLFTIDRDASLRLTRPETRARLKLLEVEGAKRRVDQATIYGVILSHARG